MIETDHLKQAVREEPGDLYGARRKAARDQGAIQCDHTGERTDTLPLLVEPTRCDAVQILRLEGGVSRGTFAGRTLEVPVGTEPVGRPRARINASRSSA